MTDMPKPTPTKSRRRVLLMLALPGLLLAGAAAWWLTSAAVESTENANLHQVRLSVASDLSGRVVKSGIAELRPVKAGDLLFQVDPQPYQLALADAEAALQNARLATEQLKVAYQSAEAQAKLAADDAAYRDSELARQKALQTRGVATETALEDATYQARRAREQLNVAEQGVANALAALGGNASIATDDHPRVQAAKVAVERAAYNLKLTEVRAPADGIVYQSTAFREGQMVAAGTPLFTLVQTGGAWVDANFKETQLTDIAVGQRVEVVFDIQPGKTYGGMVEAIGAGTGAEFSLLPAQNATGNWVKVSQRVPVRIKLDEPMAVSHLASGASAEVTVDTRPAS